MIIDLNGDSDLPVCVEIGTQHSCIEELGHDQEDCDEVDGDIDD